MPVKRILNRELSWLSFNDRVLQEAMDKSVPLIERLRFLGIFSNNQDEFFKVRIASIRRMIDIKRGNKLYGEKPKSVLKKIQKNVITLQNRFEFTYQCILFELEQKNVFIINEKELTPEQGLYVREYFRLKVLPRLSPIMISNLAEFPRLKDKSIYLATKLSKSNNKKDIQYALIEVPAVILSRFYELPIQQERKFIIVIEDVIRYCLDDLFEYLGYDTFEAWIIKLTRDAELDIDNDLSESILDQISKGVKERKQGQPVRFQFDNAIAKDLLEFVMKKLEIDEGDNVIPGSRYHNFKDFMKFPDIDEPELNYDWPSALPHPDIDYQTSILDLMLKKDFLLHVPYQNFNNLVSFLREASMDPLVDEIKITIYRVAYKSKVMNTLINAAKNGKRVTVVVELQARFDEKSNIYWSKKLEENGAKIIFGIKGLKVHSKLILVTRRENKKIGKYACVGTGNFHEGNASIYSDMFLFTASKEITKEVDKVFDFIRKPYKNFTFRHLIVSPNFQRKKIYRLIEQEITNAKNGRPAYIILKINNLVDKEVINKLYKAHEAGVRLRLIVRGICCLRPKIKGLSERIEAISIVDKFLEHTRVMVFCNDNNPEFYISSADWMQRNFDYRVEVTCPIYDKNIQKEIMDTLELQFKDNAKARILNENQTNVYVQEEDQPHQSQKEIYNYYKAKSKEIVIVDTVK